MADINNLQQDCIPVGCIPPTCCPYLPACTAPRCEQNCWHTLLKILPCPNLVVDGKNLTNLRLRPSRELTPSAFNTILDQPLTTRSSTEDMTHRHRWRRFRLFSVWVGRSRWRGSPVRALTFRPSAAQPCWARTLGRRSEGQARNPSTTIKTLTLHQMNVT